MLEDSEDARNNQVEKDGVLSSWGGIGGAPLHSHEFGKTLATLMKRENNT